MNSGKVSQKGQILNRFCSPLFRQWRWAACAEDNEPTQLTAFFGGTVKQPTFGRLIDWYPHCLLYGIIPE